MEINNFAGTHYFAEGNGLRPLGIKIEANNLSQLFLDAALKLSEIVLSGERVKSVASRTIECQAVDENSLLYEWLITLIKIADEESMIVQKCDFQYMSFTHLIAKVRFAKVKNLQVPTSVSEDINIKNKKRSFSVKVELGY